jgi:hypothetical protein
LSVTISRQSCLDAHATAITAGTKAPFTAPLYATTDAGIEAGTLAAEYDYCAPLTYELTSQDTWVLTPSDIAVGDAQISLTGATITVASPASKATVGTYEMKLKTCVSASGAKACVESAAFIVTITDPCSLDHTTPNSIVTTMFQLEPAETWHTQIEAGSGPSPYPISGNLASIPNASWPSGGPWVNAYDDDNGSTRCGAITYSIPTPATAGVTAVLDDTDNPTSITITIQNTVAAG